jgi:hypothetical protein
VILLTAVLCCCCRMDEHPGTCTRLPVRDQPRSPCPKTRIASAHLFNDAFTLRALACCWCSRNHHAQRPLCRDRCLRLSSSNRSSSSSRQKAGLGKGSMQLCLGMSVEGV